MDQSIVGFKDTPDFVYRMHIQILDDKSILVYKTTLNKLTGKLTKEKLDLYECEINIKAL